MIELLKQQFTPNMTDEEKLNRVRELLQLAALKTMYDGNLFDKVAFTGGTSLRILFDLKRFSEDLDFSVVDNKGYDFRELISGLIRGFRLNGLKAEAALKDEKNVHSAFLKFGGLPKELGLSALPEQNLSIKIEVDSNPPRGGRIENALVNKTYMFTVTHFDLPSSFATKLHACFYRKFTKGRDFYDFIWYLGKKIKPNYFLLNNVIKQTEGEGPGLNDGNIKDFLMEKVEGVDFGAAKKDVERFLEDKSELRLFDAKVIRSAIEAAF